MDSLRVNGGNGKENAIEGRNVLSFRVTLLRLETDSPRAKNNWMAITLHREDLIG